MLSIFYPISKLNIPHGVYPTIFLSNSGKDPLSPEYILLLKGSVGQFKFYLSQKSEFNTNLSQNAGLFNSFTKQNYQSLQKIQALKLYLTISPEISKNTNNTLNSTKDLSVNLLPYKKHFFFFFKKKKIKDLYFLTIFYHVADNLWPSPQNTNYIFPYSSENKKIVSSLEFKHDLNLEFGFLNKNLQNQIFYYGQDKQKLREQREKKNFLSPLLKNLTKLMIGVSRGYTMQLSLKGVGFSCKILNLENETKDNLTTVRPIKNLSNFSLDLFSHITNFSKIFSPSFVYSAFTNQSYARGNLLKIVGGGKNIILNLGFSHNILFTILTNHVRVELLTVDQQPSISIFGISLNQVNQIAANIYNCKKPEPYKGKGIRYKNEKLFIKVAKANKKI